ncbi:transcription termination factor 3, mitochondrial [Atheta coriaria]|uniref:transcription termination factor 3, mitochondrial n=1 Tax=Dalotia coriaria TaxID=877792 RepID=UPI0031F3CA76
MNNFINKTLLNSLKRLYKTPNNALSSASSLPDVIVQNQHENDIKIYKKQTPSVLDPCDDEEVQHIAPYLKPTFNFAAYVNKSETLQELVKLGVNLHKLEKKTDVPEFILGLKFETDIKEHVILLHDLGLTVEQIGVILTKNPFILKECLDDLKVRINYLESKKFTAEMIVRIIALNPFWLSFSTRDIDKKLGFFQKTFSLTGDEVRYLTAKQPKLITYNQRHIKKSIFTLKEEMGFTDEEYKRILLQKPRLFMNDHKKLLKTFEYLHNTMKISLETIAQMPDVLGCRLFRLQQRFEYLQRLNKVQFNPKQPGYISPALIVSGSDSEFASQVAQTSIQSFNTFLQTL